MQNCPKAIIFDLDDTLAESFQPPSEDRLESLLKLLSHMPLAIMTGAGFKRMDSQFLPKIASSVSAKERFYLFPNSAAQCLRPTDDGWHMVYNFALTEEERGRIKKTIHETMETHALLKDIPFYGERLFDREAEVAYTPVGIAAPLEYKNSWDPGGAKRRDLFDTLRQTLPDFEVLLGGKTTIDITRKGVNKAYGVGWLSKHLNIPAEEMLYVGDAFHEGGNDRVVIPTGINTRPVAGPQETSGVIAEVLSLCQI